MMTPKINLICSYQICAGHRLYCKDWNEEKNFEVYGKCMRTHGHQYTLEVTLTGEISSETGMLLNSSEVDKVVNPFIEKNLDHKFINEDVPFFKDYPPTAEWMAVWIYEELKSKFPPHVELKKVKLFETVALVAEFPS